MAECVDADLATGLPDLPDDPRMFGGVGAQHEERGRDAVPAQDLEDARSPFRVRLSSKVSATVFGGIASERNVPSGMW